MSYSVQIRVDVVGTPHTFLTIADDVGNATSWGFGPEVTGVIGVGVVSDNSRPLNISCQHKF